MLRSYADSGQKNAGEIAASCKQNGMPDANERAEVSMIQIKNILCPVDFFPASIRAYEYALQLAANYHASVFALHVVSPIVPSAYDFPLNMSAYTGAMQKNSRLQLAKLGKKAEQARIPFRSEAVVGSIDAEIHKALKRTKADFVVMGTHGRRGLERWMRWVRRLGSWRSWLRS